MLKAPFVFETCIFGYAEKRLDKKAKVNLEIYDVTHWTTISYNKHISQYLKEVKVIKFGQLTKRDFSS